MSPRAAHHPCAQPGCPTLIKNGASRCSAHDLKRRHYALHPRGSSTQQGYGAEWRKARAAFLLANPWCAVCGWRATVVDHVRPHRGDMTLFWDVSNWQPLCKLHHDAKTAKEGRWG